MSAYIRLCLLLSLNLIAVPLRASDTTSMEGNVTSTRAPETCPKPEKRNTPEDLSAQESNPTPKDHPSTKENQTRTNRPTLENESPLGALESCAQAVPKEESSQKLDWLGQGYVLNRHYKSDKSSCAEYAPEGEDASNWSQWIAVQQLEGVRLRSLLRQLLENRSLQLRVVRQESGLCVLRVHTEGDEAKAQEGVMLLSEEPEANSPLRIITFLARPAKVEATRLQMHLEAWMARFLGYRTELASQNQKPTALSVNPTLEAQASIRPQNKAVTQ